MLMQRVVVGLLLAAAALLLIYVGGIAFSLLAAGAALLLFLEWGAMHGLPRQWRRIGALLIGIDSFLALGDVRAALLFLALLAAAFYGLATAARLAQRGWLAVGVLYAGLPAIALVWMRQQFAGADLVLWTMLLVWATDTFAYLFGRTIGGARIWPAISPNKTWAGLAGGVAAAALSSLLFAAWRGWPGLFVMLFLGALLAVAAQAGDFFESWLKRRAGVKDSGTLLPGHGGVMDRLDGLVPVSCLVALAVSAGDWRLS